MKLLSIVVLGAGGHAKVLMDTLICAGYKITALYDDNKSRHGSSFINVPIHGPIDEAVIRSDDAQLAVIGIGDNLLRKKVAERLRGVKWGTIVHPHSYVAKSAVLGPGTVVFAGAVVQPYSVIGSHCIINTGACVDHDCRIGDYVHVAPGNMIAGNVTIREGTFLGIGCSTIPGITIGEWATVGAGAVVIRDLADRAIAAGVPAKTIRIGVPHQK